MGFEGEREREKTIMCAPYLRFDTIFFLPKHKISYNLGGLMNIEQLLWDLGICTFVDKTHQKKKSMKK